ncbi:MAG: hypothetical protein JSW71_11605 [Gemmatimonadota bacterium]|nr:MAG: hypothetical protein JSW71_11605 [Gemmatimonadota bacterium]
MSIVSGRDRDAARQLPDRFVKFPIGEAKTRITELVSQYWMSYDAWARAQLVEALLPLLKPLLESGAVVSDQERDLCEGIVASWVAGQ